MGYFILSNPVQDSIDSLLRRPCRRFDLLSEPVGGGAASSASWTESICRLHTAFAIVQRPIQRRGATGILTHASPTGTQQFLAGENACHQSLLISSSSSRSQRGPSRRFTTMSTFLMVYCYSVSTVYSPFDVFYILIFTFFLHFIPCCASASVIMCIKVPYLLTYLRSTRLQRSPVGRVESFRSWSSHLFRGRPGGRRHVRSGGRLSDTLTWSMFAGYMGVNIKTTANQVLFWKILYCTMSGKLLQSEAIFDSKCIKSVWQQRSSGPIDVAGKEKKGGEKRQRRGTSSPYHHFLYPPLSSSE